MKTKLQTILTTLLLTGTTLLTACDDSTGTVNGAKKYIIDGELTGAAYVNTADMDGNGTQDIIVSSFGGTFMKGSLSIYFNDGNPDFSLKSWNKQEVFGSSENVCFPNEVQPHDVDGDGDLDLMVPSGFLACEANPLSTGKWGLVWFEQAGNNWIRHDVVPYGANINGRDPLFFHKAEFVDLDGDGIKDLVTAGEYKWNGKEYAETYWFKGNDSADRFDKSPRLIGVGGGSLPTARDIDQDGDLDIVSAQYFGYKDDPSSFIWFENRNGSWRKHAVNQQDAGPAIQLSLIDNFFGDGITRAVGANHTNALSNPEWPAEAVYVFDIPDVSTDFWPGRIISEGIASRENSGMGLQGAPGVFHFGDVDGDSDIDLIVSGDGDPRIFWIAQLQPGLFETRVLDDGNVGQSGVHVADMNNDGIADILVTSYDGKFLAVYETDR